MLNLLCSVSDFVALRGQLSCWSSSGLVHQPGWPLLGPSMMNSSSIWWLQSSLYLWSVFLEDRVTNLVASLEIFWSKKCPKNNEEDWKWVTIVRNRTYLWCRGHQAHLVKGNTPESKSSGTLRYLTWNTTKLRSIAIVHKLQNPTRLLAQELPGPINC